MTYLPYPLYFYLPLPCSCFGPFTFALFYCCFKLPLFIPHSIFLPCWVLAGSYWFPGFTLYPTYIYFPLHVIVITVLLLVICCCKHFVLPLFTPNIVLYCVQIVRSLLHGPCMCLFNLRTFCTHTHIHFLVLALYLCLCLFTFVVVICYLWCPFIYFVPCLLVRCYLPTHLFAFAFYCLWFTLPCALLPLFICICTTLPLLPLPFYLPLVYFIAFALCLVAPFWLFTFGWPPVTPPPPPPPNTFPNPSQPTQTPCLPTLFFPIPAMPYLPAICHLVAQLDWFLPLPLSLPALPYLPIMPFMVLLVLVPNTPTQTAVPCHHPHHLHDFCFCTGLRVRSRVRIRAARRHLCGAAGQATWRRRAHHGIILINPPRAGGHGCMAALCYKRAHFCCAARVSPAGALA